MNRKQKIIFFVIILLAAGLRLIDLKNIPYGVNQDEADRAYEAYSLIKTGHDQHGHYWPLTLEAFSKNRDNASAISAYLAIPFVKLLEPTVAAVRLPSAVAGILAVLSLIYIGKRLSGRIEIGLLAGFALAVSPWHLTYSRFGHEAIWASALFLFGLAAFLKATDNQPKYFLLACLSWVLGLYGYPVSKLFLPAMLIVLLVLYWKKIVKSRFWVIVAIILGALLLIPLVKWQLHSLTDAGRFSEISVFSQPKWFFELILNFGSFVNPVEWLLGHLTAGPLDWLLVIFGIPLFFISTYKNQELRAVRWLAGLWLFLAILPSILTNFNPSQTRAILLLGPMQIVGAWGFVNLYNLCASCFPKIDFRPWVFSALFASAVAGIFIFWQPAYSLNKTFAWVNPGFLPEVEKVVKILEDKYPNAPEVRIMDDNLNQPQIYFMLFKPWNPVQVVQDHIFEVNSKGWYRTVRLGRYVFCRRIECLSSNPEVLYVEIATRQPLGRNLLETVSIKDLGKFGIKWDISKN